MRTLEAVLVLVNFFSILPSVKMQSKRVWLGTAGVNLSVFCIHGIFEGFRYQMFYSYIFVVLLTVYALLKANAKFFKIKKPKILRVFAVSLSFGLLVFTSFLAYALPAFTLPKPTGGDEVGIKYFHFVDENRTDPFLNKSTKKRELMVKVYYPGKNDNSKPYSPYFHKAPELIRLFTAGYGMPVFMFDHLNLVKTNSKEDLRLSDKQPSYPVVLFSHGAGTTMEAQTSQCEDLASQGYIVAAIDHTYVSAATVFPERIVSHREATTDFKTTEPAEVITQIMADDSKFVIDKLTEIYEGKINSILKGKLNLNKIGAIGHSVGGAVAYNLALNDNRIKAAIDLDGVVYITPKEDSKNMAPFLMLASDNYTQAIKNRESLLKKLDDLSDEEQENMLSMYGSKKAYNEAYQKAYQNLIGLTEVVKASGNLFTIEGSDHMKFTDIGFFIGSNWLRELIGIGGKTDPAKCLKITKSVTVAFFDRNLKGKTQNSLEFLFKKYPELKKVDLK